MYLSATTVGRYLKSEPVNPDKIDAIAVYEDEPEKKKKAIKSKHPNHIWTMDLSAIPISDGFWVSWIPNALKQVWPFCWWALVIIDHFSRKVIGFAVFESQPDSEEIIKVLNKAIRRSGKKPKHIISDKGTQFYPT